MLGQINYNSGLIQLHINYIVYPNAVSN